MFYIQIIIIHHIWQVVFFSVGLNTSSSRSAVDVEPHLIDTANDAEWTAVLCNRVSALAGVVCGVSPW